MMPKTKKIKYVLSIILVFVVSFSSIGAIVSDNDGAAFITKAEYDAKKIEFQSMLNEFNTGIDNKIESAIRGYIDGIKSTKTSREATLSPGDWECINERYSSSDYTWRYKHGSPRISVTFMYGGPAYSGQGNVTTYRGSVGAPAYDQSKHSIHKLLIQNLDQTNNTAEWYGIGYNCNDYIISDQASWQSALALGGLVNNVYFSFFRPGYETFRNDKTIVNNRVANFGVGSSSEGINFEFNPVATSCQQSFGSIGNKNIILLSGNKKYLNFSLYPDQRNWGFYTTETDTTAYEKLWQVCNSGGLLLDAAIQNCFVTQDASSKGSFNYINHNGSTLIKNLGMTFSLAKNFAGSGRSDSYGTTSSHKYCCYPTLGFEEAYITNWNQIYTRAFDVAANDSDNDWCKSSFLKEGSEYHIGIKNGVPLLKTTSNNTKVTIDINLRKVSYDIITGAPTYSEPTSNCYVWISDTPFNTSHPNNSYCLPFTPIDGTCRTTTTAGVNKAVEIPASQKGVAKVQVTVPNIGRYVWIKWSVDTTYGGGVMTIPKTLVCETST